MKLGNTVRTPLLIIALAVASQAHASTVVGNGGDVVERYLEATRYILEQTNARIAAGVDLDALCTCSDPKAQDSVCTSLRALTPDEQLYCRDVITKTAAAIAALNTGAQTVPLTVSSDPIYVDLPTGGKVEVAAVTDLGPAGPIVFSYGNLETTSPMALLALMSREFHQKTAYPAPNRYISNNDPIGPFTQPGGGSTLLDAVGAAISWYAYQHSMVGRQFEIDDSFSCEVQETTTGIDFLSDGTSVRVFPKPGHIDTYETGVGNGPGDLQCSLKESETSTARLFLKVRIHEDSDCADAGSATRYTALEIWRITPAAGDGGKGQQTRLESKTLAGYNPVCNKPGATPTPLSLDHSENGRHYVLTVQYQGSTGRTVPDTPDDGSP